MKLEKLTDANINKVTGKKIYCYERSEAYLKEFIGRFDIAEMIMAVIDDNKRNQGIWNVNGKEIPVYEKSYLENIIWQDAVVIIISDYYKEAYDKLCQVNNIIENLDTIYYFANKETDVEDSYRELYQKQALENIIVFRSGPHASSYVKGMDFADNARALFEYMLQMGYNEKYELIWLVKNPAEFSNYDRYKNVKFLSFDWSLSENKEERDAYYRAVCLAKFFFFTDAYGFARNRREDQIRVQLWHGCGFKTRVYFTRCEKRYEYTTVISELYKDIHMDTFGLREDQMLVTGYAKQDWLFHPVEKIRLQELGIPKAEKYIFWLPTFRTTGAKLKELDEYGLSSETGLPLIDSFEKLGFLNDILEQNSAVLVLKLHPFQDKSMIHCGEFKNIILLDNEQLLKNDIQINQLLGWADALLSDYSSAAVDYMLLDRPIGFTLEDMEEYASSRGFEFDNVREWMPGKEIFTFEEFIEFIKEVLNRVDSTSGKRQKLTSVMHRYQDDQSCKRILDILGIS